MPPRAVKAKRRRRANTSTRRGPDLISSLSDQILCHILGFLNTKEVVKTRVLSKRWKHLWASVRSLHFDSNDYVNWVRYNSLKGYYEQDTERLSWSEKFVKFVNVVLLRRKPLDLDVFRLCWSEHCSEHEGQASDWIHYAVKHHIRVFHLLNFNFFPSCIYTSTTLEELHLSTCEVRVSGAVNLPKLRKLIIYNSKFINFPKNLLSGCPILEYLELRFSVLPDEGVIAHEYLKHLCVIDSRVSRLLIDAPNLLSFSFLSSDPSNASPPPHEITLNMPSLMFAHLDTNIRFNDFQLSEHLKPMTSILGALSNVELLKLYINCNMLKELHDVQLPELPLFHKLKNVTVGFCALACFKFVVWVLNSSPNLKKLTLVEQPCHLDKKRAFTSESPGVSLMSTITLCKSLEIIEVKYQQRCVRKLVDSLIDATKELENLKIHSFKYKSSLLKNDF